jgi:hypothetical protein
MKRSVKNTALFSNDNKPILRQHSNAFIRDMTAPIGTFDDA